MKGESPIERFEAGHTCPLLRSVKMPGTRRPSQI
jgi:hypothetical protein